MTRGRAGSGPVVPKPKRPRHDPQTKYHPGLLVKTYKLLREGLTDTDICRVLQISRELFYRWVRVRPEFAEAVRLGREDGGDGSFPQWVYKRLSPELRAVWDAVDGWQKEAGGVAKIEAMLAEHGERVRQQLFLHALCVSNFNASAACKRLNISKKVLDRWVRDPEFAALVEEVQWHKKNFFDAALVGLVRAGDTGATVFANRTVNADRGYAPKSTVDVNVSGAVLHGVLDLADLAGELSAACRAELLAAVRKRDQLAEAATRAAVVLAPAEVLSAQIAAAANPGPGETILFE